MYATQRFVLSLDCLSLPVPARRLLSMSTQAHANVMPMVAEAI